jgi:serine/threonine-protein kinase
VIARTLASGDERVLLSDAMDARYVASGHLVFMRRGRLMAAPFDPDRLEVTGAAVAVVDDVMQSINWGNSGEETGAGQFAVGPQGTLVYVTGGVPPDEDRELVWVDRAGVVEPVSAPIREYVAPRLSPDGQQVLAFTSGSDREGGMRLWSYDVARRTSTPVTSLDERASWGVWSPDGSRVAYVSLRPGRGILSIVPVGGTTTSESPSIDAVAPAPSSWSRDGLLVFVDPNETTGTDIWVLDTRTGKAQAVVKTPADDRLAVLSLDGKWLAYNSDESGSNEVYVQPYPGPGARVLVSPAGGFAPTWRADGTELFYYTNTDGILTMYAVSTTPRGAGLTVDAPRKLFSGRYVSSTPNRGYDVTPDGQRFVMVRSIDRPSTGRAMMVLVENWFVELTRRVPAR